ncbi:hypothetical protein IJG92_02920 [Candidatus Saccharibacteria bacterium]|nr:hypothetical protein [Candidatus Saccharibacteria bacterium]MBQ6149543.1 hypothetical protein [Candidatus Saccharibacteria bacterium]
MGNATPFIIAVLIVGVMILVAMFLTKKRAYHFNKEKYQTKFLAIENGLNKNNSATFMKTVIDGDKLLDRAMVEMGIPGKTMGDRLKHSKDKFSDINAVWRAHKLRNALAHEDLEITYRQAFAALAIYKKALKELGAI